MAAEKNTPPPPPHPIHRPVKIEVVKVGRITWYWEVRSSTELGGGTRGYAWGRERAIAKAQRWIDRRRRHFARLDGTREVISPAPTAVDPLSPKPAPPDYGRRG